MKPASYAVVDVSDNSTTVVAGPAVLYGVYVNTTLSAQNLPIEDGTTAVFVIPASTAIGTFLFLGGAGPDGVLFETSLVVDPDDTATGSITLLYRALDKSGD